MKSGITIIVIIIVLRLIGKTGFNLWDFTAGSIGRKRERRNNYLNEMKKTREDWMIWKDYTRRK